MRGKTALATGGGALAVLILAVGAITQIPALKFFALGKILPLTEALTVKPLRGGAYWVKGGISNTGFIVGDKGVIAIDAQMFGPTVKKELAQIAKITPLPVNAMILTHSDPDHINGLPGWPLGMAIIAQETAAAEMRRFVVDRYANGFPAPSEIKNYQPTHTVRDTERLVLDGVPLVLIHTAPAHTDADLAIYLPSQRVVYAGDLLTPEIGPYPGVHLDKQGSSLGWFKAVKTILALDADIYVPGHGDLLSKAALVSREQSSEARRAQIKALFDQGKPLAEIKSALHDHPLPGTAKRFPTFVETTYQELTAEKSPPGNRAK